MAAAARRTHVLTTDLIFGRLQRALNKLMFVSERRRHPNFMLSADRRVPDIDCKSVSHLGKSLLSNPHDSLARCC